MYHGELWSGSQVLTFVSRQVTGTPRALLMILVCCAAATPGPASGQDPTTVAANGASKVKTAPTAVPDPEKEPYRFDFRRAFEVVEHDRLGRTRLEPGGRPKHLDVGNRVEARFHPDAFRAYVADYETMMRSGLEGEELQRAALERLVVKLIVREQESARADTLLTRYAKSEGGRVVVADFVTREVFSESGPISSGAHVVLDVDLDAARLSGPTRHVEAIPFSQPFVVENTLLERVDVRFPSRIGDESEFRSLRDVRPVTFVDANENLEFLIHQPFDIHKSRLLPDGTWSVEEVETTDAEDGLLVHEGRLETGVTYKYAFSKPYLADNGGAGNPARIADASRVFVVDEYGWFVFVPTADLEVSDKVFIPLVVPIKNAPNPNGSPLQFGPGVSVPLVHVNPRPNDTNFNGIRTLKLRFGLTVGALEAAPLPAEAPPGDDPPAEGQTPTAGAAPEGTELGMYIGPWASLFDLVHVGMAWRMDGSLKSKPMTYLGFSTSALVDLIRGGG